MNELENNKKIALFNNDIDSLETKVSFKKSCPVEDLKYNEDWSLLMSVVEKISKINFVKIDLHITYLGTQVIIQYKGSNIVNKKWPLDDPKKVIYLAVIEFIDWYNINY